MYLPNISKCVNFFFIVAQIIAGKRRGTLALSINIVFRFYSFVIGAIGNLKKLLEPDKSLKIKNIIKVGWKLST